jgi:hypothetical protein
MKRPYTQALVGAIAWAAMSSAWASAATSIVVSEFRVELAPIARGATPAVNFASAVGSTAESNSSDGNPAADQHLAVATGLPFGDAATATSADPLAGSAAGIDGNVFGQGAFIRTSAYASSDGLQTGGDATIGLVDGVSTASFTLAPWTLMTISARVDAKASCTGASPFELADSGVLMAIGDDEGTGPQFAYVDIDAFAFGGAGAAEDEEISFISLSYVNDTDAPVFGVFSGYVSSLASSGMPVDPVPEPTCTALLMAGLIALAIGRRRRRRVRRPRRAAMKKAGESRP